MRMSVACVLAVALSLSGCSEDMKGGAPFPFGSDHPLNVSGNWRYVGEVVADDCSSLFCSECHDNRRKFGECDPPDPSDPWYQCIHGTRSIVQRGEDLLISDHLINTAMGVELQGTVRVYSGDFLCGRQVVDESGTKLLYTEDGTFHSNDRYQSILTISSSRDSLLCKVVWSITGERAD